MARVIRSVRHVTGTFQRAHEAIGEGAKEFEGWLEGGNFAAFERIDLLFYVLEQVRWTPEWKEVCEREIVRLLQDNAMNNPVNVYSFVRFGMLLDHPRWDDGFSGDLEAILAKRAEMLFPLELLASSRAQQRWSVGRWAWAKVERFLKDGPVESLWFAETILYAFSGARGEDIGRWFELVIEKRLDEYTERALVKALGKLQGLSDDDLFILGAKDLLRMMLEWLTLEQIQEISPNTLARVGALGHGKQVLEILGQKKRTLQQEELGNRGRP